MKVNKFSGHICHKHQQFSHSAMSDSLWPHGLQQARLPCPPPTPRACSNSFASRQGGRIDWEFGIDTYQFSSVTHLCLTLCDPMDCSTPGPPVYHQLPDLAQIMFIELMPSNRLILCHPLLLLPSIFPSIRVFSNESICCIRWPKYWSFSFSISPSNEYLGLNSFRIDWFDLLAVLHSIW